MAGSRVEEEVEMSVIAGATSCTGTSAEVVAIMAEVSEETVAVVGTGSATVSGAASPSALLDDIGLLTPGVAFLKSASVAMGFYMGCNKKSKTREQIKNGKRNTNYFFSKPQIYDEFICAKNRR